MECKQATHGFNSSEMKNTVVFLNTIIFLSLCLSACNKPDGKNQGVIKQYGTSANISPQPAIFKTNEYFPLLKGKRVGVVANHTSTFGKIHLVDSLKNTGINVVRVFGPEHGFRGDAAAGAYVETYIDQKSGIEVYSLYGKNKKPTVESLKGIDILLFDIQDVGARFYTYISSLSYVMESAAENHVPLIILDRPNPNGHYVDGPVMEQQLTSFVGLHPIPIVHGMTIGEYALMVNGERWLSNGLQCEVKVILANNYRHTDRFLITIPPSPNLPDSKSVTLYPSICLFEGTAISPGRGTDKPFKVFGHPDLPVSKYPYSFVPVSMPAAPKPPLLGQKCNGLDLSSLSEESLIESGKLNLQWLIESYRAFPAKEKFFTPFFKKLAGTEQLEKQIKEGLSEEQIRKTWEPGIKAFKEKRKKYLLYPDFE